MYELIWYVNDPLLRLPRNFSALMKKTCKMAHSLTSNIILSITILCNQNSKKLIKSYDKTDTIENIIADVQTCQHTKNIVEVSHDERVWTLMEARDCPLEILYINFNIKYIKITCESSAKEHEQEELEESSSQKDAFSVLMSKARSKSLPTKWKDRYNLPPCPPKCMCTPYLPTMLYCKIKCVPHLVAWTPLDRHPTWIIWVVPQGCPLPLVCCTHHWGNLY